MYMNAIAIWCLPLNVVHLLFMLKLSISAFHHYTSLAAIASRKKTKQIEHFVASIHTRTVNEFQYRHIYIGQIWNKKKTEISITF